MDKKKIQEILNKAKEGPKRNFKQSIDLIINLKGLNLKKPTDQVEFFTQLHFPAGKKKKICAIVGPELKAQSEKVCDKTITIDELPKYADKKVLNKLASEYDYFIAQANFMAKVAAGLGRVLGPKGKMPNPKAGCVVPPNANLQVLYDKLQKTVKVSIKTSFSFKCIVGKEDMPEEQVAENIWAIHDAIVHHLPREKENIKSVLIKLTMGKPVKIE